RVRSDRGSSRLLVTSMLYRVSWRGRGASGAPRAVTRRAVPGEWQVFSRRWFRSRATWIPAVVALLLVTAFTWERRAEHARPVPFSDFLRELDRGAITAIAVQGDTLEVTRESGEVVRTTT